MVCPELGKYRSIHLFRIVFRRVAASFNTMVEQRSDWVRRIQKSLDQMNVCVHHAVSDITGATGMAIIRAIADGESDPRALARLRDRRCRKSEDEIAEELSGNWRKEHLFSLRQALRMYDQICAVIDSYDYEILQYIATIQPEGAEDISAPPPASKTKAANIIKNGQEPLRQALYRLCGFDLTAIDGIGVETAAVVVSELGLDYTMFPHEKNFISYLRLAPNLSISGGKKVPNKFKVTTCTRVAKALRMAALTLRNSNSALGAFFRRVSWRKGASVAIFATARKLAQLIYHLVYHGKEYFDTGAEAYEARFNERRLKYYTKALHEMGYEVKPLTNEEALPA